jgi:hypothetical protein
MLKLGGELDLALETVRPQCGRKVRVQNLERDFAFVVRVDRKVDRCHAAAAELSLDAISWGESLAKSFERIGHSRLMAPLGSG